MNTFSKLYLALLGLYSWQYVPTIPCEIILIGKWFHVNFYEMSSWSRSMLVPLAIINHFKPTRKLEPNVNLTELYPEGYHARDLALAPDPQMFTWRNFFLAGDRFLKFWEKWGSRSLRARAIRDGERWMIERTSMARSEQTPSSLSAPASRRPRSCSSCSWVRWR